jgi:DNA helicase-2/ATP-dependent DNA helicase PcrA
MQQENTQKVKLNDKQYDAAHSIAGPLLILAGAGAGKTKTIVERVVEIVRNGVEPRNILCVTFTNKAAAEMRERIMHRLHEEKMIDEYDKFEAMKNSMYKNTFNTPTIKTFHSLGMWIMRREAESAGLSKNFVILDSDDSKSIVKRYLEAQDLDTKIYEPAKIRNGISREKGDFKTFLDYEKKVASYSMEITLNAWKNYEASLKEQGALDFDDLIIKTVELLRDNILIRKKYQQLFKYIHIDEYQDTNAAQYELCKLLVDTETNNICVVGDTDQNIYSWRGANLRNIMNFENDYNTKNEKGEKLKPKVILLEENYRSTGNILKLANAAIKKNTVRQDKNLFTSSGDGEEIEILPAWDGDSEAECIALKIKELIRNGANSSSIAVLYRTNFQSRVLEEKMLTNDVPYAVMGTRFFDRKEIKDIMSYLKAALNNKSQPDLKRVFETPKKGVGKVTLTKLFAGEVLTGAGAEKVRLVFNFLQKIADQSELAKLSEVLTFILVESGYEKELIDEGEEGMMRLANISELITLAEKYDSENIGSEYFQNSLENFMEVAELSSDQDDDKKEIEGVRLMTVHASKGLEFDYVFVSGLEDGLFPSKNFGSKNKSKEEGEEERRLFYVAVTRARKKLFLSFAEMRTIFGQQTIAAPSEFIADVPSEACIYNEIYYKERRERVVYI